MIGARIAWERSHSRWRDVVAVLLAAWLFWLVLRGACLHMFPSFAPELVDQIQPAAPAAQLAQAAVLPPDSPEADMLYLAAARGDPLSPAPFRHAALAAGRRGDSTRFHRLMHAAHQRITPILPR